jgi:uncharacterized protein
MLTRAEIDKLVERIVERAEPERVIVFGSYAKGRATARSDLDLCVVKETHLPMELRATDLLPLLAHSLVHVDVHVYTPEEMEAYGREEYSFVHTILRSGITVYQR